MSSGFGPYVEGEGLYCLDFPQMMQLLWLVRRMGCGCTAERCSSPGARALHLSQTGIGMCGHQQGSENHQKSGN